MNRQTFNALCAQYATPETSGDGRAEWDGGKKCVIPSVKLYGAAVQDGTPTPDNPVAPVCNDGTFAALGNNLLDAPREFISGDVHLGGTIIKRYSLPGGTTLTAGRWIKYNAGDDALYRRFSMQLNYTDGTSANTATTPGAFTDDGEWHYECVSRTATKPISSITVRLADHSGAGNRDYEVKDAQLMIGAYTSDIMPPYTPYYDGGEAAAPELWAIPGTEYRDEWDAQTGWGVRRVNKLVCTPDQNWRIWTGNENEYPFAYISGVKIPKDLIGMFSHGRYDNVVTSSDKVSALVYYSSIVRIRVGREASVDDFKAFLQEQIDANTPVTIWYLLAEPESYYHPPAKLTMPNGYGQIIQTGGIADCPITAKYLTVR